MKAKTLAKLTLHDWRHTFAILMRRRCLADHLIAKQLSHKDTTLIATRCARFPPETAEVQAAWQRMAAHLARSSGDTTHSISTPHQIAAVK